MLTRLITPRGIHRTITATGMMAGFLSMFLTPVQGTPETRDKPGIGTVTDVHAMADDELLEQTAKELGTVPPSQRIDQKILNWFGLRPKLEQRGLTFEGSLTFDASKNLMGGADTGSDIFRHLLDLRFNVDTKAAFGLTGGTFSIDLQNQNGRNGSEFFGDAQGFDNADSDGRTQISELWYEQVFFVNKLRVKVGKVDANAEFSTPEYAAAFMNSSFGHSPTISTMPTYPDPSTSFNIYVYPTKSVYAGFGIYDGSGNTGTLTGSYGPSKLLHSGSSFFYIAEAGYRWVLKEGTLPGRVAIGGHYHDGDFATFDGNLQTGAAGMYAVVEQKIWHKKFYDKGSEEGVYAFAQFGHTDPRVSEITNHFSGGVYWVGPYQKTYPDSLGLGFSSVQFANNPAAGFSEDFETSVEAFYDFQLLPYCSIKPDLQYIIHPGGNADLHDALVASLRVTLAF